MLSQHYWDRLSKIRHRKHTPMTLVPPLVGRFEILGKDIRELVGVFFLLIGTPGHDGERHAPFLFVQEVALCSDVQVFENGSSDVARGIRVCLKCLVHLGDGDDLRVGAP